MLEAVGRIVEGIVDRFLALAILVVAGLGAFAGLLLYNYLYQLGIFQLGWMVLAGLVACIGGSVLVFLALLWLLLRLTPD